MKESIIPFYPSTDKILQKAKDCYLYDLEGKKYIDFESGVWCANIGHNHDRINAVIAEQCQVNVHHGYAFRNKESEILAEMLHDKLCMHKAQSVFLSSGSEAVNLSITIAMHLTQRDKILKMDNSYLSAYGFGRLSEDNYTRTDIECNNYEAIKNINFSKIAAFVIELGGASVDMVSFPDERFVSEVIESAKRQGCLIIVDEVTTGFGRLGAWFGFQTYNIVPDIVAIGKALGNGYPLSAVCICSEVADSLSKMPFRYAQSHQNDPLGCAIATEVIKVLEEELLIDAAVKTGKYFYQHLVQLKEKHPDKINDVRGKGLMLAIEFSHNLPGEFVYQELFENGFVMGHKNNTIRFLPPLSIQKNAIDSLINQIDKTINSI